MAEQVRQPVAIRVMRPYASEEAFLEREIETLTRTSIILVGAQSRPQGVVLRFEVVLENGTSLLRGEGRVVAHKPNAFGDSPGLTLRFTRLDTRSKALVDRAAAIRDAKARAALDASMTGSAAPPSPSSPPAAVRPAPSKIPADLTPPPNPTTTIAKAPSVRPPPVVPSPAPPPVAAAPDLASLADAEPILVASTGEIPANAVARAASIAGREAMLDRLRERRRGLSDARMTEILALKRRSS